jgi:hypothetical protein
MWNKNLITGSSDTIIPGKNLAERYSTYWAKVASN